MLEKSINKKIAVLIAFRDFRDIEYFIPCQVLKKAGARLSIVSTSLGQAIGTEGGNVKVDFLLENLNVDDFDAFLFVGGPGSIKYLDNDQSYVIAREAASKKKVIAAICIAPVILARAGILEGKRATVWTSPMDKSGVKILESNKASYVNQPVVVDEGIITADGPNSAGDFARKVIEVLTR
jgi:protease I